MGGLKVMVRKCCEQIFVVGAVLIFSSSLFAQLPTGTILGTVRDSSGGAVAGATVTIMNTDTNQARTDTTGDDGAFRVPGLAVGRYSVKIEKSGFSTQEQTGLALDVAQELVLNVGLQIGTSSQQVVVTGEAPLVNTTTSSLGGLLNEDKVEELPLNGRNYIDLTILQPGITTDSAIGHLGGVSGTWFSSNGAPPRSNYFMLDGAPMWNGLGGSSSSAGGTTLGVDGIKEYKIITNSFSAEYGMTMGSQMVIVSKGGTNQFHGDVFEFIRNSDLDARNFFDIGYLVPGAGRLPEFQRNNFGASFGGPIKKDKTFFYAVYEGLRQTTGITVNDTTIGGGCHGVAGATITNTACPQLGNTASVVINSAIAPLLALYPTNASATGAFTYPAADPLSVNYGQIRIDQNFSDKDQLFGRYTVDQSYQTNTSVVNAPGNPAYPQFRASTAGQNQFFTLSENHIFSQSILNTARFSVSRTPILADNYYPGGAASLTGPAISFIPGLPVGNIAISGLAQFGPSGNYPTLQNQTIYTLSDDLFYTKGKHGLKFGVLFNRYNNGIGQAATARGTATFGSVASFLTGAYQSLTWLSLGSNENRYYTTYTYGFYAQDDYRVLSRLTLNLGLRYEFQDTPTEINNEEFALRNITDPTTTQGPIFVNPSLKNFSPRVGFAWDVRGNGKTSVRSAFGIYHDLGNMGQNYAQQEQTIPPASTTTTVTNGVLTSLPFPIGTPGNTLTTMDYHLKSPHLLQYNLTVEHQLPLGVALSVSYVGSRGINLFEQREGNTITPALFTNGYPVWQPYLCNGVASSTNVLQTTNPVSSCVGPVTANPAYHRINTNFASVRYLGTDADSWYNSLQITANKHLSRGLEVQGAYTWGKSIDTAEGVAFNNDCLVTGSDHATYFPSGDFDKGPSCFDIGQTFHLSLLYHFPNVKSDNIGAKLLNGWWMGNIVTVQSGYPFSPVLGTNRSESANFATGVDRPNFVTAATAGGSYVPFNPATVILGTTAHWFNPAMFDLAPVGTLGDVPRDFLRGPGLGTWNFSLVKDTRLPMLGEAGSLQFRAEFFNVLNRANFGMPNTTTLTGGLTDLGANSENPAGSAGQITTTATTSRQLQFALKLVF